ncbi:MAG: epoxyqueuosine reductase QueH [Proteobacteria bacterium]|nr:epoxyqueuosine reductase QueH [Pseudomonadota bacterium]
MGKKILLHICCAPCAIFPIEELKKDQHDIKGFFYNPNIQPSKEFILRRESLIRYSKIEKIELLFGGYEVEEFFKKIINNLENRCFYCYKMRLGETAKVAKKIGMDAFSTTLLYSKRQKHELILDVGNEIARREGIEFLYKDFRNGWKYGIEKSKALELYRQNYCGCIFSEKERFYKNGTGIF